MVTFDLLATGVSVATFFGIYAVLSLSLNLEYGYGGQPNFGVVAFYASGAFVAGQIATLILAPAAYGMGSYLREVSTMKQAAVAQNPLLAVLVFIVSLTCAAAVVGAFGYLASYPALRLREDYLAIVLLAFGEILRVIARNYYPLAGGTIGVGGIPNPLAGIGDATLRGLGYALIVLGIAFLSYLFVERLSNSPYGRVLKSIRDDDVASRSLGKAVPLVRGQVMAVGSALAGTAGVLYASYANYIQADGFIPFFTFTIWVMVMIGGLGNHKGAIVGALVMTVLQKVLSIFTVELSLMNLPFATSYLQYIVYGVILICVLIYRPTGLIPEGPLKTPAWEAVKHDTERST